MPRDREGERWNAGIAWEFLRAHSSWDEQRLRFELHRFLGWPGQVPSYKLGERVWLQAREEARAGAGGAFSLKDFHSDQRGRPSAAPRRSGVR